MNIYDIKRWNFIHYSAQRDNVWENPYTLYDCLVSFFRNWNKMLDCKTKETCCLGDILFYAPELNNQRAIAPIAENMSLDKYTFWKSTSDLPKRGIFLRSVLYLPLFIILYLKSDNEDRKLIGSFSWDFMKACGTYKTLEKVFSRNPQLKMIVMASDQDIECRIMIDLAEKYNYKTLYVQHASVSEYFPALNFTYSFLDGMESYEKYLRCGKVSGNVFLSGGTRFDMFYKFKKVGKKYDVGIAYNDVDDLEVIMRLCMFIKDNYTSKIIVRPHVSFLINNPDYDFGIFTSHGFSVSNPLIDASYIFLSEIKVMVANESSIHLDAAIMGVPSIQYNMSKSEHLSDYYSYIKNGLTKACEDVSDIVRLLSLGYIIPDKTIRYYNASCNSVVEGSVGKMIAEFIHKDIYESHASAINYISEYMINKGDYMEYK